MRRRCACCVVYVVAVRHRSSSSNKGKSITTTLTSDAKSSTTMAAVHTTSLGSKEVSAAAAATAATRAPLHPRRQRVYSGTERSLWRFLGFGAQRSVPLHPLHHLQTLTKYEQEQRELARAARGDGEGGAAATGGRHGYSIGGTLSPEQMRLTRRIVRAAEHVHAQRGVRPSCFYADVYSNNDDDGGGSSSARRRGDDPASDRYTATQGRWSTQQQQRRGGDNAARAAGLRVDVSEEQKAAVIARYVADKWYAPLYRPFQHYTDSQIRRKKRLARVLLLIWYLIAHTVLVYMYYDEMRTVLQLSEEDRRDYVYMATNMRFGDIFREGHAALAQLDPLGALPQPARYHIVIEACRAKGWHRVDWSTQLRELHPRSALEDLDFAHLYYWLMMYVGKTTATASSYFSDRLTNLWTVVDEAKAAEREGMFIAAEPPAAPPSSSSSS